MEIRKYKQIYIKWKTKKKYSTLFRIYTNISKPQEYLRLFENDYQNNYQYLIDSFSQNKCKKYLIKISIKFR